MKPFAVSLSFVLAFLAASFMVPPSTLSAQSLTSGDVTGTVLDPSGAAVPNATVSLKNNDTGATQNTTTTSTGAYRFHLLNPGSYTVRAILPTCNSDTAFERWRRPPASSERF
jgi:protocatechuate 3,4-dioxygenase beta subunit